MKIKGKDIQNPLALALGHYFSVERSFLRETSKDIAEKIGIGNSFYRMIEGGSANLHPSKALKIIKAFPNSNINIDGLCKYIITTQIIESCRDINEIRSALLELNSDEKNKQLLKNFEHVWKLIEKEDNDFANLVKTENTYNELRNYFSNYNTYAISIKDSSEIKFKGLHTIFNDLPTFYFDYVEEFIRRTIDLPLVIEAYDMWKWEENNIGRLKNMYCISRSHEFVTNSKNLRRYKYKQLWRSNFQKANFVFLNENIPLEKIKNSFKINLKKSLKKTKHNVELNSFDDAVAKINFVIADDKDSNITNTLISKSYGWDDLTGQKKIEDKEYDALWIYTIINSTGSETLAGFSAIINKEELKLINVTSLTLSESIEKMESIKSIIGK